MIRLTRYGLFTTLAVSALVGVIGCATTPYKTSEQQLNDKDTAVAVQSALSSSKSIYSQHITVQADNGVVHLGGYVWSDFDMYEAQRIAESAPGVTRVVNEMELEREGIGNSPVSR